MAQAALVTVVTSNRPSSDHGGDYTVDKIAHYIYTPSVHTNAKCYIGFCTQRRTIMDSKKKKKKKILLVPVLVMSHVLTIVQPRIRTTRF